MKVRCWQYDNESTKYDIDSWEYDNVGYKYENGLQSTILVLKVRDLIWVVRFVVGSTRMKETEQLFNSSKTQKSVSM